MTTDAKGGAKTVSTKASTKAGTHRVVGHDGTNQDDALLTVTKPAPTRAIALPLFIYWLSRLAEIAGGRFRADLYYRINVLKIAMPALADRRGDIPQLAEYFRRQHSQQFDRSCDEIGPEILSYLQNMAWPGNLRELSNCVARYIVVRPNRIFAARTGTAAETTERA